MKLRFKDNTIRLRLNQIEVDTLACGYPLEEQVLFPGEARFSYRLTPVAASEPSSLFRNGALEVNAPLALVKPWATAGEIGLYFAFPASDTVLKVAIEKDLECLDGPTEDRDPAAYPRASGDTC